MTDRLDIPEAIVDEAASWVARLRADDVSNDDRAAFTAWLARDRRHRAEFDRMLDIWTRIGPATRNAVAPSTKPARRAVVPVALAAAVLLAAATVVFVKPWDEPLHTAHGVVATHVLEDGTRLHLNTDTEVRVDFSQAARRLELAHGELFVEVAPDSSRPLSVATRIGSATATGTAFAVRDTYTRMRVAVAEGHVRVENQAGESRSIGVGEAADISISEIVTGAAERASVASWRDGTLVYDGVRLADLIEDLNRYLPRRMAITDPELAEVRVSAVLVITDQEQMLEALSRTLPLRWTVVSDSLIILHAAV